MAGQSSTRGRNGACGQAVLAAPAKRRSQIEARNKQVIDNETTVRVTAGARPNAKVAAAAAAMAEVHCAWLGRSFAERLGSRLARPRLASRRIDAVAAARTKLDKCEGVVIKARAQALTAARACQEMGKQLTARRGEPTGAIAAIERREARMNRVRIARAGAERYLAVDKGCAKVMRETLIKETLPDRSVRKHGGLRCDGLPARPRSGGEQDHRAHTIDGEKR